MNDSGSSSDPPSPRPTLKLKSGVHRSERKTEARPATPLRAKSDLKPGARWSDEYTDRMQRDMDALRGT